MVVKNGCYRRGGLGFFMVVHHVGGYRDGRMVRGFILMRDGGAAHH